MACDRELTVVLGRPGVDGLSEVVRVLREWQYDQAPMQLHPGDLGWFWRLGAEASAAAVRTWYRHRQILAVGLLDGPTLLGWRSRRTFSGTGRWRSTWLRT